MMTPEMAEYYRAMLLVGFRDRLDQAFEHALETEEPLSDLILSMSTCISDDEQVLHILREYTLDHPFDAWAVCDLIRADVRERYMAGEMTRAEVTYTLYRIVMSLDRFWVDPWNDLTDGEYDLELFEDGHISEEVFNRCFDAWFFEGRHLNAWEVQRQFENENIEEKHTMNDKKLINKLLYLLPLAATVLTALPWCAKLRFFEDGVYYFKYFSGFSLVPATCGVWSPLVTGVCAAVMALMGMFHAKSERPDLLRWMMTVNIVAALMSITPFAFGTMTILGFLVCVALGAEAVLLYRLRQQ